MLRLADGAGTVQKRTLVVCVGDDLTRGSRGSSFVRTLRQRAGGYTFSNAGVNGDLSVNVLSRLDEVITVQPHVVIVQVGMNDVVFEGSTPRNLIARRWRLDVKQTPTEAWFAECFDSILTRLSQETTAQVAVFDLPLLGEQRDSDLNNKVRSYNGHLRKIAARHGVTVLPLHGQLAARVSTGHRPPPSTQSTSPRRLNVVEVAVAAELVEAFLSSTVGRGRNVQGAPKSSPPRGTAGL